MGPRQGLTLAYLDASAVVKLFKREPESSALERALEDWPVWVSSELALVEARCTARRIGDARMLQRADAVLDELNLHAYTPEIRDRAGRSFRPALRARSTRFMPPRRSSWRSGWARSLLTTRSSCEQ